MKKFLCFFFLFSGLSFAQTNFARMLSGVNYQSGTTYTILPVDGVRVTAFSNISGAAVALLAGTTQGYGKGQVFSVKNIGVGNVTITCSNCTIASGGAPSATLVLLTGQGADIYSDGLNYVAQNGGASGGGGGGVSTVIGTANQINVSNPTTTPQIALANNTILPGNPSTAGNFAVGGNFSVTGSNVSFFGSPFTGTNGNSGLFQMGGVFSGTAIACFDASGNITNVGCPPVTASAAGSAFEVQFRNSGVLAADSTFFQNPTTHTTTMQNATVNGTLTVASNYAQAMSIPLTPCTVSSFSPPLTLGFSGLCINNDGLVAESVNGATPVDIPLTAANSVVLAPIVAQHVVQTQAVAGTNPTLPLDANNFANIRYVTPSYNWLQTDVAGSIGSLSAAGSGKTLTLTPCPIGIDTASAANNYVYKVYIAGTGTPEAALVTSGTCTSGLATGTVVVTTVNAHSAGFTVGSSTSGIQEAWNDAWVNDTGAVPIANASSAPVVKLEADTNYNVYASIYMRGRGGWLDGGGAYFICATRDRCIYIGTTGGNPAVYPHHVINVNGGSTVSQDGVQVASVAAAAGTYTVTTASTHGFVVGDVVDCEYYSQNSQAHWVATAIGPTSGTTLTVAFGSNTFSTSTNTFGFCNILNAFIEDNSDHADIDKVNIFSSNSANGAFSYGIVNDNDQQLHINQLGNRSTAVLQSAITKVTANFPNGTMVYSRNDQGNNGITYLHNSEFTSVNCGNSGGNGFVVDNTVCQNFPLFGFRYFGGLQPATFTNIYEDVSSDNPLYHAIYSQAVPGPMGFLLSGGRENNILGAFPPLTNQVVHFPCTAGGGAERDYWVIPHTTAGANPGAGSPMFIGYATACNGGNIVVSWPSVQLQDHSNASIGTLTWDVLMTTGAAQAPFGTGSFYLTTAGAPIDGACNHGGICSFTDTQAAATSGTIAAQVFQPNFWFWPGSLAINWGTAIHVNTSDTNPVAVASFGTGMASINADQCISAGLATRRTPIWLNCEGSGGSAGQGTLAQIMDQVDGSNNGPSANSKGRINLGKPLGAVPNDLITLADSNFLKTLSFGGGRPSNDSGDMAIGLDQAGGLAFHSGTSISEYINVVPDNAAYKERLTAALKTFTLPVAITGGSSTLTVAGNTTLNGTANTIAGATTMNGALGINASLTAAGAFNYAAGGGTAQAQTVTLAPAVGSLVNGLDVRWLPSNANTGAAPTLAVNGLTAKPITKNGTAALVANDLITTTIAEVIYDGTEWQLQNPQTNFTGAITWPIAMTSGGANMATANGTTYLGISGTGATEATFQWPVARAGTVTALYCNTSANVAAGTYTLTLQDNTSAQALTCAITGSAHGCNDTAAGHAVIVAAGDLLDIKSVVTGGAATTVTMNCSLLFQ